MKNGIRHSPDRMHHACTAPAVSASLESLPGGMRSLKSERGGVYTKSDDDLFVSPDAEYAHLSGY